MMVSMADAVVLTGTLVRLEPLDPAHVPGLVAAAAEDRAHYAWASVPDGVDATEAFVEAALRAQTDGEALPFATVRQHDDRIVGSTRFCRMEHWEWPVGHELRRPMGVPDVVEIGYTWLATSAQRTGINTEAKLLMLRHAFETWRVHRVSLRTDVRNQRSRRAIERLGANIEGVRRADRVGADATVRDSVFFSIVSAEWPQVADRLTQLIQGGGRP
jgi:RimJ/RimL family protein N-acetyltransferase